MPTLIIRVRTRPVGCPRTPRGLNPFTGMLTIRQAAAARGVSPKRIRRACRLGILPCWTLIGSSGGGKDLYLIPQADLDEWQPSVAHARLRSGGWHNTKNRRKWLKLMHPRHLSQRPAWPGHP